MMLEISLIKIENARLASMEMPSVVLSDVQVRRMCPLSWSTCRPCSRCGTAHAAYHCSAQRARWSVDRMQMGIATLALRRAGTTAAMQRPAHSTCQHRPWQQARQEQHAALCPVSCAPVMAPFSVEMAIQAVEGALRRRYVSYRISGSAAFSPARALLCTVRVRVVQPAVAGADASGNPQA